MKIKSLFVGDTDNTFIQFFRYCFVGGFFFFVCFNSYFVNIFIYFVGGFAFVVDFGVMTLLTEVFSVYPVVSSTVSFVAGLLVNYLLSTFWIFKNSKIKNRFAEFLAFALIGVIGLGINAAIIWLFQNPLATGLVFGGESAVVNGETKYFWLWGIQYYHIGKIVSTVVVFLWNFCGRKFILFDKSKK